MTAYYAALEHAGLTEEIPASSLAITVEDLCLTIDSPEKSTYESDQSNNSSTVVTVRYQDTQLLFTGDAMAERTAEFSSGLENNSFDLVKIPHHGRDTETVSELIPAMKSGAAAMITSSKKEPENQAVLDALEHGGITPYLTRQGTVIATSDGKTVKILQEA